MRISVNRSGGFAGIERHATLDTTGRPDAVHLHALARDTLTAGQGTPPPGVPDGFHYAITIEGHTIHCADPHLTDAQRELIRTVLKEGA